MKRRSERAAEKKPNAGEGSRGNEAKCGAFDQAREGAAELVKVISIRAGFRYQQEDEAVGLLAAESVDALLALVTCRSSE